MKLDFCSHSQNSIGLTSQERVVPDAGLAPQLYTLSFNFHLVTIDSSDWLNNSISKTGFTILYIII